MAETVTPPAPKTDIPETEAARKKFGEDIAFGMQQTLACWATDFIDPIIGNKVQQKLQPLNDKSHKSALKYTGIGEMAGDTAGFFAFLGVQRFVPALTKGIKRVMRAVLNPALDRMGRKHLTHWAEKEQVGEQTAPFRQKLEEWKDFQADNIAKVSVMSASSIVTNVATQKAMGNPRKVSVILAGKALGAAATISTMLGVRFALPDTTRHLDNELSTKYFAPLIHWTQKKMGAEVTETPAEHRRREKQSHRHREMERKQAAEQPVPTR